MTGLNPELYLLLAVLILSVLPAWRGPSWERPVARFARHRKLSVLACIAIPLMLRAALLPLYPAPEPRVHDEFSYLLGADTLAHGRLANPTPPLWMHFESFHILVRPTYASVYPLGQAAALALGKLLLGSFWAGVWLSTGLLCGAICWMLQGWLPPRWALLGAVLVILRLGVSSYWMNSYWGGSVAALGGALVLGALPRLRRAPHWRPAVTLAAGLAILANSRSFEGLVLGLAVAAALLPCLRGRRALRSTVLPLAVLLIVMLGATTYSWARVTGQPWLPPYVLYRTTSTRAPHLLWQGLRAQPLYDNADMRNFFVRWELGGYYDAHRSLLLDLVRKAYFYWRFYLGPLLTLPLLAVPWLWRHARTRLPLQLAAAFSLALVVQVYHNFHYAAPATGLVILIVIQCMRHLRLHRPLGFGMVRYLPAACAAMLVIQIAAGRVDDEKIAQAGWHWTAPAGVPRARVLHRLEALGGRHLVLVRYSLDHHPGDEWVYNGAELSDSPVLWARELDPESNAHLLAAFRDRQAWLAEPDATPPRLQPYAQAAPRPMAFVQFGAPGIRILQSAGEIRRRMLERVPPPQTCDVWNFYFTQSTGVYAPDCFSRGERNEPISFEAWFAWFRTQQ